MSKQTISNRHQLLWSCCGWGSLWFGHWSYWLWLSIFSPFFLHRQHGKNRKETPAGKRWLFLKVMTRKRWFWDMWCSDWIWYIHCLEMMMKMMIIIITVTMTMTMMTMMMMMTTTTTMFHAQNGVAFFILVGPPKRVTRRDTLVT